jgi:hypothetical protein
MKKEIFLSMILLAGVSCCFAQKPDTSRTVKTNTVHAYFIISAGPVISAFYNDKPLSVETVDAFNEYVQANKKMLIDSWVVVTGKPKAGTFDDVIKILNRYRFKHVEKNITAN